MGPGRRAATVRVVQQELAAAELPDRRQTERLRRISEKMAARPDKGLPQIFRDASQLEGAYRFFSNPRVEPAMLLGSHAEETKRRAAGVSRIVVAHDTTECSFGGDRKRLGRLSGKARGFFAHVALALDGTTSMPLGVVHCEPLVRGDEPARRTSTGVSDETNEALRWHRGAAAVDQMLPGSVHVMDREADSYALLEEMLTRRQDFVVRLSYRDRCADGGAIETLVASAQAVAEREVWLSARKPETAPKKMRRFPARPARKAMLAISAYRAAELLRPHTLSAKIASRIVINVVRVVETHPPEGAEPVEWLLYTSLSVDTPEQILAVVDAYRQRWLIEEFFKALKTGCAFEDRQLESAHALLNLLAISIPIAWQLLRLRTLARVDPDSPGTSVLSPPQISCLRDELGPRALPHRPTARQALLAVARLGGHLSNNGDPGWITIGRGFQELLTLERGYLLGQRSDQS